ncbi:MAG: Holliday junction branch migration protein RuvA [Lachnospiraceae bacterium]|nr:Holliday junction branch migration protein RuvA [Lachnospiraceae bacterium]
MIGFIKGYIDDIGENSLLVECGGMGYNIFVPGTVFDSNCKIGREIKLYTYMSVREDAIQLYGFLTKEELAVYKMLIGVNGIGPKAGISILSTLSPNDLRYAVISDDVKAITAVPGIGSKTAQKVILELKDKLNLEDVFESEVSTNKLTSSSADNVQNETVQALVALGYSQSEALKAIRSIEIDNDDTAETLLKKSLKKLI